MTPTVEPNSENNDDACGGREDGPRQPLVQVVLVDMMREVVGGDCEWRFWDRLVNADIMPDLLLLVDT